MTSATEAGTDRPSELGVIEEATAALSTLRRLVGGGLAVAGLEAQLAGRSLGGIVAAGLAAAFALMATWLLAQAAITAGLLYLGANLALVLLALTLLNGAATLWLLRAIRRLSRNLTFAATRATLAGGRGEPT